MIKELFPGIYTFDLVDSTVVTATTIHIFVIPDPKTGRWLMLDAGYKNPESIQMAEDALKELKIDPTKLDVLLTHKHHDHTGLASYYAKRGARILMNPIEDEEVYNCLYVNMNQAALDEQQVVFRHFGILDSLCPALVQRMQEFHDEVWAPDSKSFFHEPIDYTYEPIHPGQELCYGNYHFHTISLPGHTIGHLGLYDTKNRIFFVGDHVLEQTVSIISATHPDMHMVDRYLASLKELHENFADYIMIPAHGEIITDPSSVLEFNNRHYEKKCGQLLNLLENSPVPLTIQQCAFALYHITDPRGAENVIQMKMILAKTCALLEHLHDHQKVLREDMDGIFYWSPAK